MRRSDLFGGHDGRRLLSDLYIFDTESMNWSRHTATLVENRLFIFGASDSGTFRDMHVMDIDDFRWLPKAAEGQAPIGRSRHTVTLVGKNLVLFGGVGGGRPLNDLFMMHVPTQGRRGTARISRSAAARGGCSG